MHKAPFLPFQDGSYAVDPLPDDKISAFYKLKPFADDNIIVAQIAHFS